MDRQDINLAITDAAADKLGVPTYFPLSTLNIGTPSAPGKSGIFVIELEYRFSGSSIANFGFSAAAGGGDATLRKDHTESASGLRATPAFVTGGALEGVNFSDDLFSGVTKIGTADFRLTRADNGRAGVYLSFDSNQSSATGAVTVTVNGTIRFIENDPGPAPSGGGGTTQTLNTTHYESTVLPSLVFTDIDLDGTVAVPLGDFVTGSDSSGQGLTRSGPTGATNTRIVAARAGVYTFNASLNIATSSTPAYGVGAARAYIDALFIKSASATASETESVKCSRQTSYVRRTENANAGTLTQSPANQNIDISATVKLAAGEAIGLQLIGKLFQNTGAQFQVKVEQTESELRITNTEYSLT